MSDSVLVVTEDFGRSFAIARAASALCRAELTTLQDLKERDSDAAKLMIVDADLDDVETIAKIRADISGPYSEAKKLFVADVADRRQMVQANALGADVLIPRDADMAEIQKRLKPLLAERGTLEEVPISEGGRVAIEKLETLNASIYETVKKAGSLPMKDVGACTDTVIEGLRENDVSGLAGRGAPSSQLHLPALHACDRSCGRVWARTGHPAGRCRTPGDRRADA